MSDNNKRNSEEAFPLGLESPQKLKKAHPTRGIISAKFKLPNAEADYGMEDSMQIRREEMKRIQEEQKKEQEANDAHQEQMEKYGNAFDQNNNKEYDFEDPETSDPNKDDPLSKLLGKKEKTGGFLEFFGLAGGGKSRRRRKKRGRKSRRRKEGGRKKRRRTKKKRRRRRGRKGKKSRRRRK